jgi:enoyl-CoA hydratase/carnithine racemase
MFREAAYFKINRPQRANALDESTAKSLEKAVELSVREKRGALIIASEVPGVFCAGGDLKNYALLKSKPAGLRLNRSIRKVLESLSQAPLLVVAAVEGKAVGGGCELLLACDYVVCDEFAQFAFRQVAQGLTPGWGGAKRLLRRAGGGGSGLEVLLSGRWIGAQEALKIGLVDRVTRGNCAASTAEEFALETLQEIQNPEHLLAFKKLRQGAGQGEEKIFENLWWAKRHREVLRRG